MFTYLTLLVILPTIALVCAIARPPFSLGLLGVSPFFLVYVPLAGLAWAPFGWASEIVFSLVVWTVLFSLMASWLFRRTVSRI